jgi:aminoglycoside/choline kinase family phosphotransferase
MISKFETRNPKHEALISFAREVLGLREDATVELYPLQERGSDRTFFRVKWNRGNSTILIHYDPKRVENIYYAEIAVFLREIGVPAPQVLRHDRAACLVLVEDLGDRDLRSLAETPWESRRPLYEKTLASVHRLHFFPEEKFPSTRVMLMEEFGPDLYRWERVYFKDHFVRDVCKIKLETSFEGELETELSALAERLGRTRRCLVHRDLQSQNVMIRDRVPFLIDFQGMRFGSPFYDLGSLLCDPYVNLSSSERNELLSFYYGLSHWNLDWTSFQSAFWEASAQRLMQALGAYGFLGLKKGLKAFLDPIPSGLRNLQLAVSRVPSLARLRELAAECQKKTEQRN